MSVLGLFIFPVIVSVVSQLLRDRRLSLGAAEVLRFGYYAMIFVTAVVPVFAPLGLLTVRAARDGLPTFSYTPAVPAILLAASVACGVFFARHPLRLRTAEGRRAALPLALATLLRLALHAVLLVLIILTLAYAWAFPIYKNINLEEVWFYLRMPLEGTAHGFTQDVMRSVLVPGAVCFAVAELLTWFPARKCRLLAFEHTERLSIRFLPFRLPLPFLALLLLSWGMILYACGDAYMDITPFLRSRVEQSTLIRDEYVDPRKTAIVFPEQKRNLICIYVESAETTSQDVGSGGGFAVNHIPEMTNLANAHVSFSQSELLTGACVAPACGWTMAGLVAETAGVPLKFYTYEGGTLGVDNIGDELAYFLPGATTLGDILEDAGYRNVFMAGSDFVFGGRKQYFEQHGSYEIFDLLTAKEKGLIPADYMVGWGFEDEKLYAYARDMLTELAASSRPFNLSMLTVDTHAPFYECRLCPTDIDDHCAKVLACASRQLDDFISWCMEQPFYENTTIAIMGDHASIVGEFYDGISDGGIDIHHGTTNRLVYNAFINAAAEPVNEKNRRFTTLDFFPTTLASLGVTMEGDRLALGTNLFSAEPTLSERYGYEALFSELDKKSIFYNQQLLYP